MGFSVKRRVVVTGVGFVSPLALRLKTLAQGLEGRERNRSDHPLRRQTAPVRIAGEVKGFDPLNFMDKKEARKMDRFIQFAVAATREAVGPAASV